MQRIPNWLQKLGLGQYAQRFAENDIIFDILRDLSDQVLEKIGIRRSVTAVGYCAPSPNQRVHHSLAQ